MTGAYGEGGGQRGDRTSFLHVHHFLYPVFSVLNLFSSFGCMTQGGFDLAYLTAFDPLWNNDELSFLLHPEIALVANPAAQASCAADAVAAAGGFGINELFWCGRVVGKRLPAHGKQRGHGRPSGRLRAFGRKAACKTAQTNFWRLRLRVKRPCAQPGLTAS